MPAKLSLNIRPNVAAGLANEVDAVNQYAAPMYAATMAATRPAGARRITSSRPNVATPSAIHCPAPLRSWVENCRMAQVEHRVGQPRAEHRAGELGDDVRRRAASAAWLAARPSTSETAGLKCAPLIGPNTSISTYRPPTVASVLASSARATLPLGQPLGHDPGADHHGQEQRRAERLGEQLAQRGSRHALARPQQQDRAGSAAAWATSPRGAAPAQQADLAEAPSPVAVWLNVGMLDKVWKCSQAMPCGSVTQCFSLRA